MNNIWALVGELLSVAALFAGLAGFLQFYSRTKFRPHLAMLIPVIMVLASTALIFSDLGRGDVSSLPFLLLLQSLGIPFYVYWGEQNRSRMEEIAMTGAYDAGFPLPSENYIKFSFFGQIYEDLAKPIIALKGERGLNRAVNEISQYHPILKNAHFTEAGEFRLDRDIILSLGEEEFDLVGFTALLDLIIEEYARLANTRTSDDPSKAIRAKWG